MLNSKDIWLQIPPEEKFELLAQANSKGASAAIMTAAVGCVMAMGLHMKLFMWVGILAAPVAFQFAAGKAWRFLKPRVMLQYLGARSVSRRFAYAAKARDLTIQLLFRGKTTITFEDPNAEVNEALEEIDRSTRYIDVWIALLNGAVVAFREGAQGAEICFVSLIDDKLGVQARNRDGSDKEYSDNREVFVKINQGTPKERQFKIASKYPGVLVAFEKKLEGLKELAQVHRVAQEAAAKRDRTFED